MVRSIFSLFVWLVLLGANFTVSAETPFKPEPIIRLSTSETLTVQKAWQRQQVILSLSISTPDEFARIETEPLELSDFEVIEIPFERSEMVEGKRTIKVGWVLFPLVAGQYDIELPKMVYRPSSGRKIKLKNSSQALKVKLLPSYIPATMPIGKVSIKNTVQHGRLGTLHETQTLINWDVELVTNAVFPQTIPPLLRQIKTTPALDIFPETLKQKQIVSYRGIENKRQYKIPLKALKSGLLDLPELSIQYFDPSDGKLKRTTSKASTQWALNPYLQLLLLALIVLIALFFLRKMVITLRAIINNRKMIHQAMQTIKQANNTQEIRTALHQLSKIQAENNTHSHTQNKDWHNNSTLQQYLKSWETQKGENLALRSVFQQFKSEQFSGKPAKSIEKIKKQLIECLKRA